MQNTTNYNDIKKLFTMNSIKDKITLKATNFAIDKIKNHFGVSLRFATYLEVRGITDILKELDPGFKTHVINQYGIDSDTAAAPLINDEYIFRVKSMNAFAYVNGKVSTIDQGNNSNCEIWLYIFGKGAYRLTRYIKKKMNMCNNNVLTNYAVTGMKRGTDDTYWNCIANDIPPRTFDTLFFDDEVIPKIKNHLSKWISNIDIYRSRNLNYKTGILIHGPAGTGKSSLAVAIASYLNCNMISVDMSTFDNIDIVDLTGSINADKDRYVIFLDEIDVVFKSRDENITDAQRERTTKLLTFLDSANSPSNVVFVATTNYFDRLDAAVTRKGRFDLVVHVDNLTKGTAEKMCEGFGTSMEDIQIEPLPNGKYNPATLQSAILDSKEYDNINND